jgi:hypothetical protein
MSQERPFGIEPPPFHHNPDSIKRQTIKSTPLLRIQLSSQPHETPILSKFSFQLIGPHMQNLRQLPSGLKRAIYCVWNSEYGRHLHIHGQNLAMSVDNRAARPFQRYRLLVLSVRFD